MDTGEAQLLHQSLHGAARDAKALATQLLPDLLGAVDTVEAGVVDALDLGLEDLVTLSSSGLGTDADRVVGGGGELQRSADRLDSPSLTP